MASNAWSDPEVGEYVRDAERDIMDLKRELKAARASLAAERERSRRLVDDIRAMGRDAHAEARECLANGDHGGADALVWVSERVDDMLAEYEGGQTNGE